VVPGSGRNGRTEIRGPLTAGDRVVTLGVNLVKDGQRVRIKDGKPGGPERES
jgi:hypothetical protein